MQQLDVEDLGTILSVWAHPDDETFLAAGLMARAAALGHRVVCVSATRGEHGTDDPQLWPPERLGRVRALESRAAMAILGVHEHRFLDHEDGTLGDHEHRLRDDVAALLDELEPDTVVSFGSDGITFHPDHLAVHRAVRAACRAHRTSPRLLEAVISAEHLAQFSELYEQWGIFMTDQRPVGVPRRELAVQLELEGPALDQKVAALLAMATQTHAAVQAIGLELFRDDVAEESFWQPRI